MTGYQGRSIGIWKSSGHPAIPAPQHCSLVGPGRYMVCPTNLLVYAGIADLGELGT